MVMPDWPGSHFGSPQQRHGLRWLTPRRQAGQQPRRGRGDFGDGDDDYAAGKAITGEELRRSYGPK
jgi:hypothetical protein